MKHPVLRSNILYRCFATSGELLYVGIALDMPRRMKAHRSDPRSKRWVSQVAFIKAITFPDWSEAHAAEVEAITAEHPLFNIQHNKVAS